MVVGTKDAAQQSGGIISRKLILDIKRWGAVTGEKGEKLPSARRLQPRGLFCFRNETRDGRRRRI